MKSKENSQRDEIRNEIKERITKGMRSETNKNLYYNGYKLGRQEERQRLLTLIEELDKRTDDEEIKWHKLKSSLKLKEEQE